MDTKTVDLLEIKVNPARLIEARKKKGLSQTAAAKALGFTRRQALWNVETGLQRFNSDDLAKACLLYDVEIAFLVS